jgi:predicted nucleic acid-binding protein
MIFDSDVLVWYFRRLPRAIAAVEETPDGGLSVISYMELLQGARDKRELAALKAFVGDLGFRMIPLTENIGHRAAIYLEEHFHADGLPLLDALIAATAVENNETLLTGNVRHFRCIPELQVVPFSPRA